MISVYRPEFEDLWFRREMLADEETMSYNRAWGGTIDFPEEDWRGWFDHWLVYHEGSRFYRYIKNEDGAFVGEIAYHFDEELKGCVANVIVFSGFRGRGYGGQALDALCFIAKENGVEYLYDDIAIDNPAIGMFLRRGFIEEYRTPEKIVLKKKL